ncbi:hypothetical protein LMG28727_04984 [Paraburkholderia kirstenboschensis]|uniref:hypothetical protein n=1 Tax=Paraburkholderia kirstenboschensis TaxID=1245436 RepID=UPI000A854040|nr:hypothetical protein [Paraburkholderia kirstenboschensis]CAD6549599.1 hypothetical protein LMG28727_04984 [Paraburkholderia kirstenboschensis]
MSTCPLRCEPRRTSTHASSLLALVLTLSALVGWRALRDLLNAIPDSNEDFGLF